MSYIARECYKTFIYDQEKVTIIGAGRLALDFLYMFPEVNVEGFVAVPHEDVAESLKDKILDLDVLHDESRKFILCTYQKSYIVQLINEIERYDLIPETEFWKLLDFPQEMLKDIFLGEIYIIDCVNTGAYNQFVRKYRNLNVVEHITIIAENEINDEISNKCDALIEAGCVFIILGGGDGWKIRKYFQKKEYSNWYFWSGKTLESEMMKMICLSKPVSMNICMHPFNFIEILPSGDEEGIKEGAITLCCPMYLEDKVGNIRDKDFKDIWNSRKAQILRLSMINRTFAFCNMSSCSYMKRDYYQAKKLPIDKIIDEKDYSLATPEYPEHVAIDIDNTCNLHCRFCRKSKMIANGAEKETLNKIALKIERQLLPHVKEIMLAGNGEVFFSPCYMRLLCSETLQRRKERPKLQLTTNGLLFTEENFKRIEKLYSDIELWVSIDAADKNTYENIRRGGKWERLKKNMEYASFLRKSGRLSFWRFNFVVTKNNYKEMPAFIEWGKTLGVDSILFQRVEYTGSISLKEHQEISLFDENGQLKEEYLAFFENPIFKDKIVNRDNNVLPMHEMEVMPEEQWDLASHYKEKSHLFKQRIFELEQLYHDQDIILKEKDKMILEYQEKEIERENDIKALSTVIDEKDKIIRRYQEDLMRLEDDIRKLSETIDNKDKIISEYQKEQKQREDDIKNLDETINKKDKIIAEYQKNIQND